MYRKKIPDQFPPSLLILGQEYLGFFNEMKITQKWASFISN